MLSVICAVVMIAEEWLAYNCCDCHGTFFLAIAGIVFKLGFIDHRMEVKIFKT